MNSDYKAASENSDAAERGLVPAFKKTAATLNQELDKLAKDYDEGKFIDGNEYAAAQAAIIKAHKTEDQFWTARGYRGNE